MLVLVAVVESAVEVVVTYVPGVMHIVFLDVMTDVVQIVLMAVQVVVVAVEEGVLVVPDVPLLVPRHVKQDVRQLVKILAGKDAKVVVINVVTFAKMYVVVVVVHVTILAKTYVQVDVVILLVRESARGVVQVVKESVKMAVEEGVIKYV